MNALGIVIDVAHAGRATTLAVCERIAAPVICSHTSARLLHDFPRFLSDDELGAIIATDGLVGLWPFRHNGKGIAEPDDFTRHADHLGRTAGPDHVCIGTDMNGVPGLMAGYRGECDFPQCRRRCGAPDSATPRSPNRRSQHPRILAAVCR